MSTTIGGVRIVDMPDLGAITDDSSVVGEHAGSGRFAASALRSYVAAALQPEVDATLNNTGRNLLHNPLFNVAQRGNGPWTSGYTMDRWQADINTDTVSINRGAMTDVARTQVGDESATYYFGNTFTGNAAAAAYNRVSQKIEDARRLAGKTVTVSFYAGPSASLKLGVGLSQYMGSGGSPSATVNLSGQAVQLASGVWARHSVTFSIPSVAGMTLGTNNDSFTLLGFWFSSGTTQAMPSGNPGVQSGTINLWGVQLEIGSVATPLEKPDPRYDLSNCQRFYQTMQFYAAAYNTAGGGLYVTLPLNTAMRVAPTVLVGSGSVTNASGQSIGALGTTNNVLIATATVIASGTAFFTGTALCSADL